MYTLDHVKRFVARYGVTDAQAVLKRAERVAQAANYGGAFAAVGIEEIFLDPATCTRFRDTWNTGGLEEQWTGFKRS